MGARRTTRWLQTVVMLLVTAGLVGLGLATRPARPSPPARAAAAGAPVERNLPERLDGLGAYVGEEMEFEFGWQATSAGARVPAARARVTVAEREGPRESGGRREIVIRGSAATEGAAALLWQMKDRFESVIDAESLQVKTYVVEQRENQYHQKMTVTFGPDGRSARTQKVRYHRPPDDPRRVVESARTCFARLDPAGLAYLLRAAQADAPAGQIKAPFFDGEHSYFAHLVPLGRGQITVKAGTFEAVQCELRLTDIDRKPKPGEKPKVYRVLIWVSTGPERLPLKLTSETFVGEVYGELVRRVAPARPGR